MENNKFCQSCSMPLDNSELLGTEKDGSKNHEYCKYCYQDGAFTNPGISLEERTWLVKKQMEKMNIEKDTINLAVHSLPNLKRWKSNMHIL